MNVNPNGQFTAKVAFVTGAANGIGRAAALAFAREGASVVVADIAERNNQETARMVEDLGARTVAARCNVTRDEDIQRAMKGHHRKVRAARLTIPAASAHAVCNRLHRDKRVQVGVPTGEPAFARQPTFLPGGRLALAFAGTRTRYAPHYGEYPREAARSDFHPLSEW